MSRIRRQLQITFVTGLLVIIPIAVPVWVFWELFTFVDRLLDPVLHDTFPFRLPGLGLLVATLLVLLVSIVATNVVVRRMLGWLHSLLYRVPIFRSVYSAVKQLLNAFSPDNQVACQGVRDPAEPRRALLFRIPHRRRRAPAIPGYDGAARGRVCSHQPPVLG